MAMGTISSAKAILASPKHINLITAPTTNPDGVRPVYSNNAALLMGAHDIRILFTEVVSSGVAENPHVELRASVIMTPTQVKALAEAIKETITQYEAQFGEIIWPPSQRRQNKKAPSFHYPGSSRKRDHMHTEELDARPHRPS